LPSAKQGPDFRKKAIERILKKDLATPRSKEFIMSLKNRKLGRTSDQRKAMLRAMVTYLLENGQIKTTVTRAKEVAPVAEKMITLGKDNTLASYRQAMGYITKEDVAQKLFKEIAPKYADRNGGYTRIVKIGPRRGDAAEMAIIQLV
jgi:large subunit ribosomal protein L17